MVAGELSLTGLGCGLRQTEAGYLGQNKHGGGSRHGGVLLELTLGKKGEGPRDILTPLSLVQTRFCSEEGYYLCLGSKVGVRLQRKPHGLNSQRLVSKSGTVVEKPGSPWRWAVEPVVR